MLFWPLFSTIAQEKKGRFTIFHLWSDTEFVTLILVARLENVLIVERFCAPVLSV